MEYGLIKDTTIQALADGLREKEIIPSKASDWLDYLAYKTPYATSLTDPTPNSKILEDYTIKISIPEATSLEFVIHVGKYLPGGSPAPNTGWTLGRLSIMQGSYAPFYEEITATSPSSYTFKTNLSYPTPNTATFTHTSKNFYPDYPTAVTFEVYPLDADGNRMQVYREVDRPNLITPEEMVEAVEGMLPVITEDDIVFTGNFEYFNYRDTWSWLINKYGDKIKTKDITSVINSFYYSSKISEVPFVINVKDCTACSSAFYYAINLTKTPKIRGTFSSTSALNFSNLITNCYRVRDFEDLFEPDALEVFHKYKPTASYSTPKPITFYWCCSLRKLPSWFKHMKYNPESAYAPSSNSNTLYYNTFSNCYALDEILDVPVWTCKADMPANSMAYTFTSCSRARAITFETDNGVPKIANWKSQTLDLLSVGSVANSTYISAYNSGITPDKEVKDDATYQALKNDPDWYTLNKAYSRYNHDSAVETINSLPNVSATSTCYIKFLGAAGEKTDGGAINTLTPEEIAVADAKGWRVTLS